ncbi:hypothetical protein BDQ12DRAFT_633018 [Crucibulum laeve]|uniref:SH3 domain-containing protein n=1 Tax=Crucibulum laeve TaxID=68775 RepID=A0A5C3LVF0_9AGAR|nr:hypothetical protein BDQ12DRAFT_633018 [Crucibulum laeve]
MKLTNPLPQPLSKECLKAAKIFKSFVDNGNNGLDGIIPRTVLENAKGFAIFTVFKAGFVFSARAGSGIVIAKLEDGTWSAPSAIGTAGLGVGGQAGAEMTDFLVVLNSRAAIRSFMAAGSLTLGGNMSIALGPLGRNGEATGAVNTNGKVAAMYSYSKTRGLFGGVSVEGSVIVERQDANVQAYDSPVTAKLLLGGMVDPPSWAMPLIKTLESCTGMPGNRQWVNDDSLRTPSDTYAFGAGVSSPGAGPSTPSFLRKKKKSDAPSFPPPSWGKSTDSGSYFSEEAPRNHSRNMTWDAADSQVTSRFETTFESDFVPEAGGNQPKKPRFNTGFSTSQLASTHNGVSNTSTDLYSPSSTRSHNARSSSFGGVTYPSSPDSTTSLSHPQTFIKPKPELARPLLPQEGVARAIALFDFQAVESGDLSFSKGDVITITRKSDSNDDWWTGKIHGREGIFPANFVEVA